MHICVSMESGQPYIQIICADANTSAHIEKQRNLLHHLLHK